MAATDEQLLEAAARDGTLDASSWPTLLQQILKRMDHIVHHDFPIPVIPPPPSMDLGDELGPAATPRSSAAAGPVASETVPASSSMQSSAGPQASQDTAHSTPPPSHIPATSTPGGSQAQAPSGAASQDAAAPAPELPPPVLAFYQSIIQALQSTFPRAPPFTIQRLAELVQSPRQHYRTLPAYLRALDRAVAVSSPTTVFPLPTLASNDDSGTGSATYLAGGGAPGDDFNAAALTRIPWLKEGGGSAATPPIMTSQTVAVGTGAASSALGTVTSPIGAGVPGPSSNAPQSQQRTTDLHTARTERIDGPLGAGSVETVTVGTQRGGFVGGGHFGSAMAGSPVVGGGRALSQHLPSVTSLTANNPAAETSESDAAELVQAPTLPSNAPAPSIPGGGEGGGPSEVDGDDAEAMDVEADGPAADAPPAPLPSMTLEEAAALAGAAAAASDTTSTSAASTSTSTSAPAQVPTAIVSVTSPPPSLPSDTAATADEMEFPHARGPSEIGISDTGPQPRSSPLQQHLGARSPVANASSPGVLDAENAIGRPGEAETVSSPTDPERMVRSPRLGGMDVDVDLDGGDSAGKTEADGKGP